MYLQKLLEFNRWAVVNGYHGTALATNILIKKELYGREVSEIDKDFLLDCGWSGARLLVASKK